jgi:hypothetical protein
MRLTILPILGEDVETPATHMICPPEEEDDAFRMAVFLPERDPLYFQVTDLPSLLTAFNYEDMFSRTKVYVLQVIETVVAHYSGKIWSTKEEEIPDEYKDVRKEVVELVKLCCVQEASLLSSTESGIRKTLQLLRA